MARNLSSLILIWTIPEDCHKARLNKPYSLFIISFTVFRPN